MSTLSRMCCSSRPESYRECREQRKTTTNAAAAAVSDVADDVDPSK